MAKPGHGSLYNFVVAGTAHEVWYKHAVVATEVASTLQLWFAENDPHVPVGKPKLANVTEEMY